MHDELIKKNIIAHLCRFGQAVSAPRVRGIVSCYERYTHVAALRFCRELGLVREYIRGDKDVIRDIAAAYDTYELLYPEPREPHVRRRRK